MQNWILIKKYVCAVQTTLITRTITRTFSFQNVVGHWDWNLTFVQITAKNCLPSTFRLLSFFFRLWDGIISCQSNQAGSACAVLCLFLWTNFEFQNNSGRILASCRLAKPTTKPAWTCKGVRHFGCIYYRSKFIQIPHKSSGTPSIFVLILQPCAKH